LCSSWRRGGNGTQIELLRECNSPETFFFAARDYVKISRASTDATGASLTSFGRNVVELFWRIIFAGGERGKASPTTKSQSQLR
jgi:hypothetical protein